MAAMECITTEFHGVHVHFIYFKEFLLQYTIGSNDIPNMQLNFRCRFFHPHGILTQWLSIFTKPSIVPHCCTLLAFYDILVLFSLLI